MKSKDLQNVVLCKHQSGDHPRKIFRDLGGALSLDTIQRWVKMIEQTGFINLSKPPGRQRTARTKASIQKVKQRLARGKRVSERKMARELGISDTSVHRILRDDLGCYAYKIMKEPAITDVQKANRKKFSTWVQRTFRKDDLRKVLFSDEKMFDIDGVYNSQNDRIWAVNRAEANKRGGVHKKRKFPTKVMVWLGACSQGLTPLVILDEGSVDHRLYIKNVLPVVKKFGDKMLGDNWTFQQDNAPAHRHQLTQEWCSQNLPSFIPQERWPANSPDFNPLDYCLWNELVQAIEWRKVKTKLTLIAELKRAVKKIRLEVVAQSVDDFSKRMYRTLQNDGNYLT